MTIKLKNELCSILNCGYDDLEMIMNSDIDISQYVRRGIYEFNEIYEEAFYDKIEELDLNLSDFTIETNFVCTDIYIRNRNNYSKDTIEEIETFMNLEFIDMD